MSARDPELATLLAAEFRKYLVDEYVPRVRHCTQLLSTKQCWVRQGTHGNSIGVLLRHLEGNVRQWILCGLGGDEDHRDRPAEFAAEQADSRDIDALVTALDATVRQAAGIVERMTAAELAATYTFQGKFDTSGLAGVVHVIEHFSGHAGQIYAFTKQMLGVDLKFWDL